MSEQTTTEQQPINNTAFRRIVLRAIEEGDLTEVRRLWVTPPANRAIDLFLARGYATYDQASQHYRLTASGTELLGQWSAEAEESQ